ncbi:MAG: GIY-YIG nuclease family protein [Alphaproteobacteria bacterium]|nr:GIY-YIG nuclease family protein [Alphaproteobacteria bacterium]
MNREDKKAAVAAYKERKADAGVYAVRCAATGEQWVGGAPDLAAIWNRISFALRQGVASPKSLQGAWNAHGADGLRFDVLETLTDEQLVFGRDRMLKERRAHWCAALHAEAI